MTVCKQRFEHSLSGYVRYTSSHYYYYLESWIFSHGAFNSITLQYALNINGPNNHHPLFHSPLQLKLDQSQEQECNDLQDRLRQEMDLLHAYQSKTRLQEDAKHQKEIRDLEDRVSRRRAILEQKVPPLTGFCHIMQDWTLKP